MTPRLAIRSRWPDAGPIAALALGDPGSRSRCRQQEFACLASTHVSCPRFIRGARQLRGRAPTVSGHGAASDASDRRRSLVLAPSFAAVGRLRRRPNGGLDLPCRAGQPIRGRRRRRRRRRAPSGSPVRRPLRRVADGPSSAPSSPRRRIRRRRRRPAASPSTEPDARRRRRPPRRRRNRAPIATVAQAVPGRTRTAGSTSVRSRRQPGQHRATTSGFRFEVVRAQPLDGDDPAHRRAGTEVAAPHVVGASDPAVSGAGPSPPSPADVGRRLLTDPSPSRATGFDGRPVPTSRPGAGVQSSDSAPAAGRRLETADAEPHPARRPRCARFRLDGAILAR